MHLEKNRTYACTFSVQRKEIKVVKVRFTTSYSSRKLSNYKLMTTACNFWRQIARSFQVMSGNILSLGNKIFEIPPFFQARPEDLGKNVHACSLRFSALNHQPNHQPRPQGVPRIFSLSNMAATGKREDPGDEVVWKAKWPPSELDLWILQFLVLSSLVCFDQIDKVLLLKVRKFSIHYGYIQLWKWNDSG